MIKFKPGIFRILINSMWGVILLFFGVVMTAIGIIMIISGENWILAIAFTLLGPGLIYWSIISYFIGSFTSYFLFDGSAFEFRNVKTRYRLPLSEVGNIKWITRKGKLQSVIFLLKNGTQQAFDGEIYSRGDQKNLIRFLQDLSLSTGTIDQSPIVAGGSFNDLPQKSLTQQFCGECGKSVNNVSFCQNCGSNVVS